MSRAIPAGITAEAIRLAASRLDTGEEHPFGTPTSYEAVIGSRRYAPKALIGLAAQHALGLTLLPTDFKGGERPGEANGYLRRLGFDVVSKEARVGEDWTDDEIWAAIDVYFDMLLRRLNGERFVKAALLRALSRRTHGRSVKSAEYKLQNISAILVEMGLTRLEGLTPASNYQTRLGELVDEYIATSPSVLDSLASRLDEVGPHRDEVPLRSAIEEPPPPEDRPRSERRFRPRKVVDRAQRDAANRGLGSAGEAFVVAMERESLLQAGRGDLAARVRWVADLDGDGAGYDVRSFDPAGNELYIEVKTTNGAKETPFFLTANELEFSARNREGFRLYRVFAFSSEPRLFILMGDMHNALALQPVVFRARARSSKPEPA